MLSRAQRKSLTNLMTSPAIAALPKMGGDQCDLVSLPGRTGIRIQHTQPASDIRRGRQPGQRQVWVKPPAAHLDAGLRPCGPDTARESHQLFASVFDPRPQHLRLTGVRKGSRAREP